jgi:hypothetical protein
LIKSYCNLKLNINIRFEKKTKLYVNQNHETSLLKKIAELERVIGSQQLQIIYKDSIIQNASSELGVNIEKKFNSQQ